MKHITSASGHHQANGKAESAVSHQKKVKQYYNRSAKDLSPLRSGQPIFFQHPEQSGWIKGTINEKISAL